MKKILTLSLASMLLMSSPIYASDIYYKRDYIVSNIFTVRPEIIINDSTQMVSNIMSIRPQFVVIEVDRLYSELVSIVEMPNTIFMSDGVEITESSKVKNTSKLSFSIDYGENPYSEIKDIKYYVINVTDNERFISNTLTLDGNKVESDIKADFIIGKTYEIGQITKFADGFSYETTSVPFIVNEKGIIEFSNISGNILFTNKATLRFESKSSETLNTYNVYLEYTDGSRLLVGNKIKAGDTIVSKTDDGYDVHEFKHDFTDSNKKFKYVIQVVE